MTRKQIIRDVIIGVIAIAAIILIISLATAYKNRVDDSYKEQLKAKDETIQAVRQERDTYRKWKDEAIVLLREKDSMLQTRYKTNTIRYEKIPVTISNYSDDELRSAVENFR